MGVNFYMDKDARKTKRFQWMLLGLVISALFIGIFLLDSHLDQNSILVGFNIREHYGKPFPYLLDPFTYVGLKGGSPIVELTPPDPNYTYSFEEVLVTRFIDYYIWEQSGSKEIDNTFKPSKLNLTINGLVGHLRNRINYRVDHGELGINSIMRNGEEDRGVNTLVWNVIPYCVDPVLELSLHELANRTGFLFVRGNYHNFRFVNKEQEEDITKIIEAIPMKMAYINDHSFLNFTRYGRPKPVQISIICDPIQRKLRHFNIERANLKNWDKDVSIADINDQHWWGMSLEECMSSNHVECQYDGVTTVKETKHVDLLPDWSPRRIEWTVPQFCDYSKCTSLGRKDDLAHAWDVVRTQYTVVGTLESMDETLELLEERVPQFFKGIKEIYKRTKESLGSWADVPRYDVSPAMKAEMSKKFAPEFEFYRFVAEELAKASSKRNAIARR